ncbi:MAG: hypothetical protein RQ745_11610 [Longimicrobiales bacterium]|nr:hypothetical protein [Longimicrobiales bacterium]
MSAGREPLGLGSAIQPWWEEVPAATLLRGPVLTARPAWGSLSQAAQAAVAGDSVLVVFDPRPFRIWTYPLDGGLPRSWGEPGRGPGEFRALDGRIDEFGRVWAWDRGQLRVSIFDLAGGLVEEFPLWSESRSTGRFVGVGESGCLWFVRSKLDSTSVSRLGYGREGLSAQCVGSGTLSPRVPLPGEEHIAGWGRGSAPIIPPFGRRTLITVSAGRLWASDSDSLMIMEIGITGVPDQVVARPEVGEAIPPNIIGGLNPTRRRLARRHMPDGGHTTWPDLVQLWGVPGGGGWVELRDWIVRIDPDGTLRYRLALAGLPKVIGVGDEHIVTLTDDASRGAVVEVWVVDAGFASGGG